MKTEPDQKQSGAVLLEVVLALTLFVGAALVIGGGLSASVTAMERNRRNAHAGDLAVTVMSELQMGITPVESSGPNAFDPPFEMWSWETVADETGAERGREKTAGAGLKVQKVEVVIRLEEEGFVFRLAEFLPGDAGGEEGE